MVMVVVFEFSVMRCQPLRLALCFHWEVLHSVSYKSMICMLLIGTNKSLIKRSLTGCQVQSARHQGKLSR
ncbi:hypothetical protein DYC00_17875 [Vibrio cholerae]|nr:hypothetical protein [Vibrio cholerae]